MLPAFDGFRHGIGVQANVACDLPENVEIADIKTMRKVSGKHCFVKGLKFALLPGNSAASRALRELERTDRSAKTIPKGAPMVRR